MQAVGDGPLLRGLVDGDMLGISAGSLSDVLLLVPHDLADVGGVSEDHIDAAAVKFGGAVGFGAQRVDLAGHGGAAEPLGVEAEHHLDESRLRLVDLQGGLAVDDRFSVAIGGVGHVAPRLDRLAQAALEPLVDDLVLPAAHKGLQLGVFLVDVV